MRLMPVPRGGGWCFGGTKRFCAAEAVGCRHDGTVMGIGQQATATLDGPTKSADRAAGRQRPPLLRGISSHPAYSGSWVPEGVSVVSCGEDLFLSYMSHCRYAMCPIRMPFPNCCSTRYRRCPNAVGPSGGRSSTCRFYPRRLHRHAPEEGWQAGRGKVVFGQDH